MTTGVAEILGAKPFPFLNFIIYPEWPSLLEGLFQQVHYVNSNKEVG